MPKKLFVEEQLARAQAHDARGVSLRYEAKKAKVMSVLDDNYFLGPLYALVESLEKQKEESSSGE